MTLPHESRDQTGKSPEIWDWLVTDNAASYRVKTGLVLERVPGVPGIRRFFYALMPRAHGFWQID